jgi:hypothetical protein
MDDSNFTGLAFDLTVTDEAGNGAGQRFVDGGYIAARPFYAIEHAEDNSIGSYFMDIARAHLYFHVILR